MLADQDQHHPLAEEETGPIIFNRDLSSEGYLRDRAKFETQLQQLAENPIGNDEYAKWACQGFLLYSQEDPRLLDTLQYARRYRATQPNRYTGIPHPLTRITAVVMATTHIPNFIHLIEGELNYPVDLNLTSPEAWKERFKYISNNYFEIYQQLLLEQTIHTTEYNRGIIYPTILNEANLNNVRVADLGTGANWLWSRLVCGDPCAVEDPFTTEQDETGIILAHANTAVNHRIADVIGIDLYNPLKTRELQKWFLANRHIKNFTPDKIERTRQRIDRYSNTNNVHILEADVNSVAFPPGSFDIVSMSTFLYQVPYKLRKKILQDYSGMVTPNGFQVVGDYIPTRHDRTSELELTPTRHPFEYATAIRGTRTDNNWLILARYENSTCRGIIQKGEDFDIFLEMVR